MGSTTLEERPVRVVTLDPSLTDAALLLKAEVAGYAQYRADPDSTFPDYLGDVSSSTADAVNVGAMTEPNLEKILDVQPDVIISAKVRHEALYDQLSKIAPTVFADSTGPTWKGNILMVGDVLGQRDEAQRLLDAYHERATAVGAEILAKSPETTYSLVRFAGEDTARLYSSTSFIGEIMGDMAIPRPEGAPDTNDSIFVPLSAEQIPNADASLIMVSAYTPPGAEGEASQDQRAAFEANPLWGRLEGEILPVDDVTFVASVSLQGAHAVITQLAEHYGVDPREDLLPS
ncbi:iron-siderophore ABC transporter substrate-binding protein [uncultured Aeromicrobium sp.]|uniref:ABC transporter substrate-binding protein n=1 Tax=uncultured Aeromicrobium sp. TaxID=337820 RepID=UPI0025D040ED|nr:iron-siderophore ABC transporter substrate-binding protein [uncultured Aeromicrobium sp.]